MKLNKSGMMRNANIIEGCGIYSDVIHLHSRSNFVEKIGTVSVQLRSVRGTFELCLR